MPPESPRPGFVWIRAHHRTVVALFAATMVLVVAFGVVFLLPPRSFPQNEPIVVPEGASVRATASLLKEAGVIRSPRLFRLMVRGKGVRAGNYVFAEPKGLLAVASAIARGESGMAPVRVTFPEGITVREMADVLATQLVSFDRAAFLATTTKYEGYVFPDTYFFSPFASTEQVVATLRETFDIRLAELSDELASSPHTLEEIIIMASLLEKEAKTLEDKRMIAGILWNRLDIGMALQVDAVFGYIKGTETFHPSLVDLEIDSPYNTYRNRGLPPTPIANPGIESIRAALTPIESDYLYYLTGRDGVMRYARTFDGHRENRTLYLD